MEFCKKEKKEKEFKSLNSFSVYTKKIGGEKVSNTKSVEDSIGQYPNRELGKSETI